MMARYLDISFEAGRPLAAYLHLRDTAERSAFTDERSPGIVVDFDAARRPIGVEITEPGVVTLAELNRVLSGLGEAPATAEEFRPLLAA